MASSRRPPSSQNEGAEPFPAFSGQDEQTTSVTTSTTTQTVIGGDGSPDIRTTTTAAHPTGQTPSAIYSTNDPNTAPVPFSHTTVSVPSQPAPTPRTSSYARQKPIGIRRLPSSQNNRLSTFSADSDDGSSSGRRRSLSAPQDPHFGGGGGGSTRLARQTSRQSALPPLQEGSFLQVPGQSANEPAAAPASTSTVAGVGRRRSISNAARSIISKRSADNESARQQHDDYEDEVVDLLDVIGAYTDSAIEYGHLLTSLQIPRCRP